MNTAVPPEEVAPKIWPIKQLLLTFAPVAPTAITLLAVVTPLPAPTPMAVLKLLVVRLKFPFLFPRCVDSAIAGPEEAKNLAGKMSSA